MSQDPDAITGSTEPEVPPATPPVINNGADPRSAAQIDGPDGDTVKQPGGDVVKEPGGDRIEPGGTPAEIKEPRPDTASPKPTPPEIVPPPD